MPGGWASRRGSTGPAGREVNNPELFELLDGKHKPFIVCFTKIDECRDSQVKTIREWALAESVKYSYISPFVHLTSSKYPRFIYLGPGLA